VAVVGTGLAPFIAFLEQRKIQISENIPVGKAYLYFGCRARDQDFIFQDELMRFFDEGSLSELQVAFSRETPEKVYVQHKLLENKEKLWRLVHQQKASILVCGAASTMAVDVRDTWLSIIEDGLEEESGNQVSATTYLQSLEDSGRYTEDVWG
jgi:sulfite reductase alpha subunit-like flavoprotein